MPLLAVAGFGTITFDEAARVTFRQTGTFNEHLRFDMNLPTIVRLLTAFFAGKLECKATFFHFLAACQLVTLAGPARSDAPDLFSGVYMEIPVSAYKDKDTLYYIAAGPSEVTLARNEDLTWAFRVNDPMKIDPLFREWREVEAHLTDTLFDNDTPRIGIVCITPQKAENYGPLFCRIPIGTIFGFRENGSSFDRKRSNTGYFMAIGTPAGVFSPEFRKLR